IAINSHEPRQQTPFQVGTSVGPNRFRTRGPAASPGDAVKVEAAPEAVTVQHGVSPTDACGRGDCREGWLTAICSIRRWRLLRRACFLFRDRPNIGALPFSGAIRDGPDRCPLPQVDFDRLAADCESSGAILRGLCAGRRRGTLGTALGRLR